MDCCLRHVYYGNLENGAGLSRLHEALMIYTPPGSRDSTFVPHIRWPGSIGQRGVPTEFGYIQRRRMFWENSALFPLPSTSRSGIRRSRRTWRQDRSLLLALVVNGREGQCSVSGGGSNWCAWTQSRMQLDPMRVIATRLHPPLLMRKGGGLHGHGWFLWSQCWRSPVSWRRTDRPKTASCTWQHH